jgi:hypothetical protein
LESRQETELGVQMVCSKLQRTLEEEWRRCTWIGKMSKCKTDWLHDFFLRKSNVPQFNGLSAEQWDRLELSRKRVKTVGAVPGAIDLSFRKAAGLPMFKLIVQIMQIGVSSPRFAPDQINAVSTMLDKFSDKTVLDEMVEVTDAKFESDIAKLSDIDFGNLLADSGTVLHFSQIPCLPATPDWTNSLVLLNLYENRGFCAPDDESLSRALLENAAEADMEVAGVIIDNYHADANRFNACFRSHLAWSGIIHVKCFAHMANLMLTHDLKDGIFQPLSVMYQIVNGFCTRPRE